MTILPEQLGKSRYFKIAIRLRQELVFIMTIAILKSPDIPAIKPTYNLFESQDIRVKYWRHIRIRTVNIFPCRSIGKPIRISGINSNAIKSGVTCPWIFNRRNPYCKRGSFILLIYPQVFYRAFSCQIHTLLSI